MPVLRTSTRAKSTVQKTQRKPLSPKIAALLRESWWLLLVGAALYLVLIFATYHRSDPGWSHEASATHVINAGGKAGAWIADIALYVFGASAWWWVVFFIGGGGADLGRLEGAVPQVRPWLAGASAGLVVPLTATRASEPLSLPLL